MKFLVLIISLVMFLSSCSGLPIAGGDDLLQAPMLNQMQKEVYDALELTLDTNYIVYSHPQTGEHRSPFVFYDLDGDDMEEAIVFYAYSDTPDEVFAKILSQQNGKWNPVYDIPGKGPRVEFIDFAPLLSEDNKCIIIGWSESTKHGEKTISIHSFKDNQPTEVFEESYRALQLVDGNEDKLSDLILIQKNNEIFELSLLHMRNRSLAKIDSITLYEETTDILQILTGKLPSGNNAIFIDEEMAGVSVSYGTEVVEVGGGLSVLIGSEEGKQPAISNMVWESFTQTFRMREILCVELDGTGEISVPRIKDLNANAIDSSKKSDIELIEYMNYDNGGFVVRRTAVINPEAGYLFYFPERWIDNVTIVKEPQRQEWQFSKIDPSTGQATTELLRIRLYYAQDYMDEFTKDDIFLGTKGLFSYYGYIPQTYNEPLAITQQEAEEFFALI